MTATEEKHYSYLIQGTQRPGAKPDPSVLAYAAKNRVAPGQAGIQSLADIWRVAKESAQANVELVRSRDQRMQNAKP